MKFTQGDIERAQAEHERLKREYDWFHYMPWYRRWFLRLTRIEEWDGMTSGEDTHCFITCSCGEEFSANEAWVTWCPQCGAGYSTEFKVYKYRKAGQWQR